MSNFGCESSETASAYVFGGLPRGVSRIAFSFLNCFQGYRAIDFLGRDASFGLLSLTNCPISKFRFACSLRG
jgi:hypothetical protein